MKLEQRAQNCAPSVDGDQHKICSVCGQAYDAFDFTQQSHHAGAEHAPMKDAEESKTSSST